MSSSSIPFCCAFIHSSACLSCHSSCLEGEGKGEGSWEPVACMRARDDGREGREGRGHPREADRNKREAGEEEGQGGETGGLGATKRAVTFAEFIGTAERKSQNARFLSLSLPH